MRIIHGLCDAPLRAKFIADRSLQSHRRMFSRQARDFLSHLESVSGLDLSSKAVARNAEPIREALFLDLTRCWKVYPGSACARELHPVWGKTAISLEMMSRYGASLLHGAVCGYSMLRGHLFSIGQCPTELCRYGCNVQESLEHVLLECQRCDVLRDEVSSACRRNGLAFTVRILMCHPSMHLLTEKFFVLFVDGKDRTRTS